MITIGQLADWIITNRRDKAFKDYSKEKIIDELNTCANSLSMLYVTNESDEITGVVCCKNDSIARVLYVYDILATKPGVIKHMLQYFLNNFPQYKLEGINRNGRKRTFNNPIKLYKRI